MGDKADVTVDTAALGAVDAEVLAALRVGQRLVVSHQEGEEAAHFSTEAGVHLAPLADPNLAARFPHPKVIVRAIKREAGSGAIQLLQLRLYRADAAAGGGRPGGGGGACSAAPAASTQAGGAASGASGAAEGSAVGDDCEYKLRRQQYQALAESSELRSLLADPRLQDVLSRVDGAGEREKALALQLENPDFQPFVTQVLMSLDPGRVPATAATAAAVAMQ
ncbi:hypothetical protein TSOC_012369 [Tetrabaena socialis]|uniref:Zinc finger HIT domain-containing protein n=1 Tax=Tetrabaena socialis TaxID=47790 RepID=A0A2J7ZN75_9CHLO|nr:hypothetical protein TSOC_012369 [Tetrabaena socialis]|eukprot:PNH01719.1 hypothetical protein TSOC_012369 [Tetrabaena socialis]